MSIEADLGKGLIKGRLLSEVGGTALIYEAIFNGSNVVIKQARTPRDIPIIQREYDFLLNSPNSIHEPMLAYGIPHDWNVSTRFVRVISNAVSDQMYSRGIIVLEKIAGESLVNTDDEKVNLRLPLKFHFGAIMGWINMLRVLKQHNITMDSNIDTDMLILPNVDTKTLETIRIDCSSSPGEPNEESMIRGQTNEQVILDQIIYILNRLYPMDSFQGEFLGYGIKALKGRFKEGIIHDSETLYSALKSVLSMADWKEDFVKKGDQVRMRHWVNPS